MHPGTDRPGNEIFRAEDLVHSGKHELDLGREGGHSKRRILHAKDVTGREIERALLNAISRQPKIQIFEDHLAIDLRHQPKLGYVGENAALARTCSISEPAESKRSPRR
jgi:aspartate oxidase